LLKLPKSQRTTDGLDAKFRKQNLIQQQEAFNFFYCGRITQKKLLQQGRKPGWMK
jgi:hypothetical protein